MDSTRDTWTDDEGPVVSLIEWQAPTLNRTDARRLAEETAAEFRRIPGAVEIRFFGDPRGARRVRGERGDVQDPRFGRTLRHRSPVAAHPRRLFRPLTARTEAAALRNR